MAGWNNFSDLISEITTGGKYKQSLFNKVSSAAIGINAPAWAECYTWTGIPGAGPQTGVAGTGTQIKQSVQGSGIDIGAAVLPDIRTLLTTQIWTSDTLYPAVATLVDYLVYWPACVVTGVPTTLVAAALPRYTDGVGVMGLVSVQSALGAAKPNLTLTCTYNDNASAAASAAIAPPYNSAPKSHMFDYHGTPFVPLPTGKTGIKSIDSYTIDSGGTTGTACFFLVKPITSLPILNYSTPSERDLLTQLPSLPRIYDDAHLGWIIQTGATIAVNGQIGGYLGMGWG